MSSSVLDASALLALINGEPGHQQVRAALLAEAAIGVVNLAEVVTKLVDAGMVELVIRQTLAPLRLEVVQFDAELAYRTGLLRRLTRQAGLSLGDRACLALAQYLALPVLTADRAWQGLQLGVAIQVIR